MTEDEALDARATMHFISIQSVLDPDEAELARAYAESLSAAELRAWFDQLNRLPIAEAVLRTRAMLIVKRGAW
jgi:hypothetical protein